jgi:hypothetical protein
MLCFNVILNGQRVTTAGIDGLGVVSAILTRVSRHWDSTRTRPSISLNVGGLQDDVSFTWLQRRLRTGDVVTIELREQESADEPHRRTPEQAAKDRPKILREELKHVERRRAELLKELQQLESKSPRRGKRRLRGPRSP